MNQTTMDPNTKQGQIYIPQVSPVDTALPSFDLNQVKIRAGLTYGFEGERLDKAIEGYRQFLLLCKENSEEKICPTPDVDNIWHLHMLDSKNYMADCQKFFGYYLHHEPCIGAIDEKSISRTIQLHAQAFGDVSATELNHVFATCANPGGGCGSISH